MAKKRTVDGVNLADIIRAAEKIPGVFVTTGNSHPYLLKCTFMPAGNCALATSTHADRHVVPWLRRVTGYETKEVRNAIRTGEWPAYVPNQLAERSGSSDYTKSG